MLTSSLTNNAQMHRINATILDIFTIDYIVLYCIYKQTCEPGPKFEMALKHQASKVYVWAETLYTEDTKAYDDMFAAIFGALAGKHIQYLLGASITTSILHI